jgi:hypothetical protein
MVACENKPERTPQISPSPPFVRPSDIFSLSSQREIMEDKATRIGLKETAESTEVAC